MGPYEKQLGCARTDWTSDSSVRCTLFAPPAPGELFTPRPSDLDLTVTPPPPPLPFVLIGHAASFTPY